MMYGWYDSTYCCCLLVENRKILNQSETVFVFAVLKRNLGVFPEDTERAIQDSSLSLLYPGTSSATRKSDGSSRVLRPPTDVGGIG